MKRYTKLTTCMEGFSKKAGEIVKKELDKPMPAMSRRTFLGALGAAYVGLRVGEEKLLGGETEEASAQEITETAAKLEEREIEPNSYDMGPLAGRRVGDLFAFYLGVPEGTVIPEKLEIDFYDVLEKLWERKLERVRRKQPDWAANSQRAAEELLVSYATNEKGVGSLPDLLKRMDNVIEKTQESIDWARFSEIQAPGEANFTNLNERDVRLVHKLSDRISGQMLAAYSATELMPALEDYKMNVDMYEFLLTHAGSRFLRSIPAINDNYLSLGLFQFTSYAVYDDGKERRGASVVNSLLPHDEQIPGYVKALVSEEDQVKAAHLFAVFNIGRLLSTIRKGRGSEMARRMDTLHDHADSLTAGLLQYIASAHHNPYEAQKAFIQWIDAGLEGSHAKWASSRISGYIRKSHGNYYELKKHID